MNTLPSSLIRQTINWLVTIVALLALLQGCATARQDVSISGSTALVKGYGSNPFGSRCGVFAEPPYGGRVKWDSLNIGARKLTIDSGQTTVIAYCNFSGMFPWSGMAIFKFDAKPNGVYTIRPRDKEPRCLELINESDAARTITCEPYTSGDYVNLSAGDTTAYLIGKAEGVLTLDCLFDLNKYKRSSRIAIDPGELTITAKCFTESGVLLGTHGVSQHTFTPISGHEYAIALNDAQEFCVIDLTNNHAHLDCQPFKSGKHLLM